MIRAGSTLQYNIVRSLVEKMGLGRGEGFFEINHVLDSQDKFDQWESDNLFHVIKTHDVHPKTIEKVLAGLMKVCYIYRDIRDVAASLKHKMGIENEELFGLLDRAISIYYEIKNIPDVLFQRYEDVIFNLHKAVMELATFFNLVPERDIIESVVIECSINRAQKITQNLKSKTNISNLNGKSLKEINNILSQFYDKKTLLHPNHISKNLGIPGSWQVDLSKYEKKQIMQRYARWLSELGYTDPEWSYWTP
jgi:hypothetical protein